MGNRQCIELPAHAFLNLRPDGVRHIVEQERISHWIESPYPGDGFLVVRAVMRMGIEKKDRIPAVQHVSHQAADFRAFEFHTIAIQVLVSAVKSDTDTFGRAVLTRSVFPADLVITIDIEDRRDQYDQSVENVR